jgi:hypothetical protein
MTASAVLILAIAMVTGLSVVPVVPVVPASAGMSLPSKTVVFSGVIRSVPLNFSSLPLILVEEEEPEAFAVDFSPVPTPVATRNATPVATPVVSPVATPVATPVALEEEEDAPLPFPTKNATATDSTSSTTGGPSNYYENLLQEGFEFASSLWRDASASASPRWQESYDRASSLWEDASPRLQESYDRASSLSYDLASSLWEDASHVIAYSNEKVSNKNGSPIQVSKVSLHIFSARFTVMFESGIVKASIVFLLPEITRILSKQCPLTSPSQPTCNDVVLSPEITRILSKQCPLTPQSQPTCNVDAMDILTSITMILSKQCPLTPPIKTTCNADEILSAEALALIFGLVFIAGVLGLCLWPTICSLGYGIRRVSRTFSLAVIFMYRATFEMFPEDRIMLEVQDLCLCKLMREYCYWTGAVPPTDEITDEVKKGMIRRVANFRGKAYRQGKWDELTMSECLRTCCTEVSSSLEAEVHHFHHSSPDEKLRRDIGEKCHCVLKEEYIQLTGNKIVEEEAGLSALKSAVFQAHKKKSAHRFCYFGRGR